VVKVVTAIQASGKKPTAAAITVTVKQLGCSSTSLAQAQARVQELDGEELGEKGTAKLTAAADAPECALALYEEALTLGGPPAHPVRLGGGGLARLTPGSGIMPPEPAP